MKQWEYKIETTGVLEHGSLLLIDQEMLAVRGKEGWEMVSAIILGELMIYHFKRKYLVSNSAI